jgi:succinate-acetate transporter protein
MPEVFAVNSIILAMGVFYGGLAQIVAGILEFRKGNTFGVTAFTSYGLFWMSLVFLWVFPTVFAGSSQASAPSETFMGWYLFMWGFFTMMMFIGTLKKNFTLSFVFLTLFILFYLLALRDWGMIPTNIAWFIGVEGIVCGFSAVYLAMAEVINENLGRTVLPIGRSILRK